MRNKFIVCLLALLVGVQVISLVGFQMMDSSITPENKKKSWNLKNLGRKQIEEKVLQCEELVKINNELIRGAIEIGKNLATGTILLSLFLGYSLWQKKKENSRITRDST